MATVCKKCGYARKPNDIAPDYECPNCGAVYAKVEAQLERKAKQSGTAQTVAPRPKYATRIKPAIKRALSFLLIVFAWLLGAVGVLNLLAGDYRLAALTLPALLVAIPSVRKLLPAKTHAPIIGLLFVGIVANAIVTNFQEKERRAIESAARKEKREQYAAQQEQKRVAFNSRKPILLSQARLDLNSGNFGAVLSVATKWASMKDKELGELEQEAFMRAKQALVKGNSGFLRGFSKSDFPQFAELSAEAEKIRLQAEARAKEEACKADLQCWGDKHTITAGFLCDDYVEKLAKYSFEWTDGFLERKFSHFRWKDRARGTITFIGDKIRFQNGFGAWQNYIYECDLDPSAETVLDVRARPGRL